MAPLPVVAIPPARIDPGVLARRLVAIQPSWPSQHVNCRRVKCVALTFDDGPGDYTDHLLDLLKARHVRATFFVVGQMVAADKKHLVRRIFRDGHELGNHSWSHPQLTAVPDGVLRRQLRFTQRLVRQLTGVRMQIMRPPYGSTDSRVADEARRDGLAQILWSVDTLDWQDHVPAIVARRATTARSGAIVLMHDIHRTTVEAVPKILDTFTKKGFTFVTVSELFNHPLVPGRRYSGR
ncbi:polysaccharide deacetylase family protein [Nonomuraea sp. NPDC000554]|uniref:polysaccharide deacetylase family protein n=1 Tax=Nonomuraea sp. NPDC000554 TaxID=3154259 RepID=UPI00333383A4